VVFLLSPTVAVVVALRTTSGVAEEAEAAQVLLAPHQLLVLEPMAEIQPSKVLRRVYPLEVGAD
jgi:putative NIF3 family GTP cyclohydrolase 1 type 2